MYPEDTEGILRHWVTVVSVEGRDGMRQAAGVTVIDRATLFGGSRLPQRIVEIKVIRLNLLAASDKKATMNLDLATHGSIVQGILKY